MTAKSDADRLDEILKALDFSGWVNLSVDAERILLKVAKDGAEQALEQIGFDATPEITDQLNEASEEFARDRGAELVGMKVNADGTLSPNPDARWAITDSTRELLRSDVEAAIDEGLSTADLAARLEEGYAFSDARAETIARTEVARADVEGNLAAYRESGVISGKQWILGSEHAGEDECNDAADMGVVGLEDDFGGIGDPPAHPNCECDVLPVLAEEAE